ncbi:unnamed protein product [Medioppia subpectinata]|uniref:peptide-methionine (S)-S-oxide reductase n=1 Tax=Medioppia subpectinata TaxID=1979941 RepID=A0A7R9KX78_9ACAR|nr:unnamed protein product [Medioppia subpectinata]CAG2111178.1 unnamed protein product [Medioppia subpectinata]
MNTNCEAIFGLQCFWGSEVKFGIIQGVIGTSVGYTGGSTPDPTYKNLKDHIEVVKVVFDPKLVTYEELLSVFWSSHDPTFVTKRQYMSAIFYNNSQQRLLIQESLEAQQRQLSEPIVTQILPFNVYYLAEDYHQKYFLRKHQSLLLEIGLTNSEVVLSPVAARLNAYCAGFGSTLQLDNELKRFGLHLSPHNHQLIQHLINSGPNLGEC